MARWKPDEFQQELDTALEECDYEECSDLCKKLVEHLHSSVDGYPLDSAKSVLSSLRRKRYFDLMAFVADTMLRADLTDPQIQRQYAQALLDQGNIYPALSMLQNLLADQNLSKREREEAQGLIGRAYKQIYTDADDQRPAHNKEALKKAISSYYKVYEADTEEYWHGVNAVALLARAHQDGVDPGLNVDYSEIATSIVGNLGEDGARDASMWELATLTEACIALKDWDSAIKYLGQYIDKNVDAFEVGSTLRQFETVWKLDTDETEERALIDLLRSTLLKQSGGELIATADKISRAIAKAEGFPDHLQKVLDTTKYQSYKWLLLAMQHAKCIGRIWHGSKGIGTGFLVSGETLSSVWSKQQVFVTNNHVISEPKGHPHAILPEQAKVTFDILFGSDGKEFKVKEILWQSSIDKCDTTVLLLDEVITEMEYFNTTDSMPSTLNEDRIYVIGHPNGGELSFSFQDNTLVDFDDRLLHYRSPTDPGSSGSPIFNEHWELIGLHHAGSKRMPKINGLGTHPANEGITLPAIRAAIEKSNIKA